MPTQISESEQQQLIEKLDICQNQRQRQAPAALSFASSPNSSQDCERGCSAQIFGGENISSIREEAVRGVVNVHTGVQRCENFPGISAVRSIYDAIPFNVKRNLEAVYFLHPGLQALLFLATFGAASFSTGGIREQGSIICGARGGGARLRCLSSCTIMMRTWRPSDDDYGLESDHPRVVRCARVDSPVSITP
ncbi:hypothetical protein GBA52_028948 [Prunus armeniaca]|nr:hypothetical protein GBA52_028948 [Prunus armeniaca]